MALRLPFHGWKVYGVLITVVASLSVAQTVHLTLITHTFGERLQVLTRALAQTPIVAQDVITDVTAFGPDGQRRSFSMINAQGTRSLVVGLAADCEPCNSSLAASRRIGDRAVATHIQVVWVSRDDFPSTSLKLGLVGLPGILLADPTHRTYMQVKLSSVPQLALVSAKGRVDRAWHGAIDAPTEHEIISAIEMLGP